MVPLLLNLTFHKSTEKKKTESPQNMTGIIPECLNRIIRANFFLQVLNMEVLFLHVFTWWLYGEVTDKQKNEQ